MRVSETTRSRVVMFDTGAVFIRDWVAVARRVADVIRLRAVHRSTATHDSNLVAVDAFRGLYRDPSEPQSYAYAVPAALPYRLFGQIADTPNVRALERALRGVAAECGPIDILHGHFYADARPLPALRRRLNIPYVVTEHSTALTQQSPDKTISRVGRRIARRVYADAAYILPVSRSLLGAIERLSLPGRLEVIDNPVDISTFGLAAPYTGGPFRVVCTARLDPVKAVDVLLGAAARLAATGVDLDLTVFGDGPERDRLKALACEIGLADRVAFPGFRPRPEIFNALARAHAFAMASVVENQPFAIIEALCSGVPVVATAVGGVPELVGGDDGLLVPPRDANALANALGMVAHHAARFEPAVIAKRARARFSYETVAASLARVYADALATVGGRVTG